LALNENHEWLFAVNAGSNSVSSFKVNSNGGLTLAHTACWVTTTKFGRLACVANTGSNTISSYYISSSGKLYFIPWANTPTGKAPADLIVSADNYYVYNINGTSHTLGEFKRAVLGTLNNIGHVSSIPEFAAGMVAY